MRVFLSYLGLYRNYKATEMYNPLLFDTQDILYYL